MKRNQFDLSHEHKTSLDMGWLQPVMCEEVLPGDTFIHRASALARVAPLAKPLMHRVELRLHSFFVPNRILWEGWENFITGEDFSAHAPKPTYLLGDNETLWDHLGVPPQNGISVDAMPMMAYNMIWNEYYRDQDLQQPVPLTSSAMQRICWQKDYFTIARPQPQTGLSEPIPVSGGTADIFTPNPDTVHNITVRNQGGDIINLGTDSTLLKSTGDINALNLPLQVDFSQSQVSLGVDDLRRSIALQRFAEARMRFGHRYVDYLRYCGVNPSDGRLSRPEYFGGGKQTLNFSEVLATAADTDVNVGDLYGHGIGMANSGTYKKFFEEHGFVLTLMSARPKTVYQDNVPKKFLRKDPMDYHQKELEILPWQEIRENEVHHLGDENNVWGYVPRYEEYRHGVSKVTGTLRGGTENDWHMGREFSSVPPLNGSFVECTPTERVYSDANMPDLIVNVMHRLNARRYIGETASMGQKL